MKFINQLIEGYMPRKRGFTKFVNTTDIKKVMHYEVTDNVR
jgi:hypothetical protein